MPSRFFGQLQSDAQPTTLQDGLSCDAAMDRVRNALTLGRVVFVVAAVVLTTVIAFFATKYGGYGGPEVAFEVTRDSKETNGAGKHTIGYEETVLNDGDGMDATSGKFTVPLAGVYRYSF